jgi:signal transduction histidine kinase
MTPQADRARIEMGIECGPTIFVTADRRRLVQIVINLLSNSLKNTPEGGTIKLAAKRSRGRVELVVTDTGRGIPADQLERIFENYSQLDGPTVGSGLGLPVSRRLAEVMGGELTVASEVGIGSSFTLTLPAVGQVQPAA